MYHVIPKSPQHHNEKQHLYDRNKNKPMDEQNSGHNDLEDYRVEPELIGLRITQVNNITVISPNAPKENAVSVKEPYNEKQDLHAE
jgi:NACalpha-BTF3-like transcription factor